MLPHGSRHANPNHNFNPDHDPSPSRTPSPSAQVEKLSESASRQQIDNSIEGLRAYLSALNIRNKCKHPLFLALRFDSCVRLFYDSHRVCNPLRDDEAFYHMMEVKAVLPLLRTGCAVNVMSTGGS